MKKKYHIHYSTNIPSDNGKNARGFQGIHTQIRIDSYRWYGWKTDKKEYKILGNCRIDCDENKNFRLTQPGIDGDKYYNLVKTKENGKVKYEVVEAGSYIATAEEIILQPLN